MVAYIILVIPLIKDSLYELLIADSINYINLACSVTSVVVVLHLVRSDSGVLWARLQCRWFHSSHSLFSATLTRGRILKSTSPSVLAVGNLAGSVYQNSVLLALVEFPAYVVCYFLTDNPW